MKTRLCHHSRRGYTLVEVLAAGALVSVGMTAAVSLTSSLMLQEELAWRTAITRNYQENMVRLWQLGMGASFSNEPTNITAVMPRQSNSPMLNEAINGEPYLSEIGTVNPEGLGTMQVATVQASVNISRTPNNESQGSSFSLTAYRPKLPLDLRTAPLLP